MTTIQDFKQLLHEILPKGRLKPAKVSDFTCRYCGKALKNDNAHSGHMARCAVHLKIIKAYLEANRPVFRDEAESRKRWESMDHSHFNIFEHEVKSSPEAIEFVRTQVDALTQFPDERLEKHCVFYLVVLAQIADKKPTREKAFNMLKSLISADQIAVLVYYWPSLGNLRYSPATDAYVGKWAKFARIKDDSFFYIDYPVWILLLDRYILTYKNFGWRQNDLNEKEDWFIDMVLQTIRDLMLEEHYYLNIMGGPCLNMHVPKAVIPYLHSNSRKRFSKNEVHWVKTADIGYNPSDPASGTVI